MIVFEADLCFSTDVFYLFFSTRDLRVQSVDQREILHGGQN